MFFTADVPHDALRAWATARGLRHEETGLLPPVSEVLREGFGAGAHRAGLITHEHDRGYTSQGGFEKRPERESHNLCTGVLPGGLNGVLAHHAHLEQRSSTEGGQTWVCQVHTVVVARLPERCRPTCHLTVSPGAGPDVRSLGEWDLTGGMPMNAMTMVVPIAEQTASAHGFFWRLRPAEDDATLDAIAAHAAPALASIQGAEAEYEDGMLCVSVVGTAQDAAVLDALCQVAAGVANGLRAAAARHPLLDAATPVGPPRDSARRRWLDEGYRTLSWPQPPASISDAQLAYANLTQGHGENEGSKMGSIVLIVGLIASVLFALASVAISTLFDGIVIGLLVGAVGLVTGVFKSFGAARSIRQDVTADEIGGRAKPWGIEAFMRGYAESRGLAHEDADEVRHRLDSPLPGRPVRVLHGDLGDGVPGHLALWQDWTTTRGLAKHWLVAVVAARDEQPVAPQPYLAARRGDLLVVGVEVPEHDRSAAQFDALAVVARGLAGRDAPTAAV